LLKEASAGVVSGIILNILKIFIYDLSYLPWKVGFLPEDMVVSLLHCSIMSADTVLRQVSEV